MKSKKLFTTCLAATLALTLVACSGNKNGNNKEETKPANTAVTEKEEAKTAPVEETEVGQGTFYLENESGTTENGDPIVIYDGGDTQLLQIGLNTDDFDGSKLTYVYIDGELVTKEQYGDSQSTLDLESKHLKEGTHQVVLKQYENDDEKTDPVTVKFASYEVKAK